MPDHLLLSSLVFAGMVSTGCTSTPSSKSSDPDAPQHPIAEIVEASNKPEPIGKVLATLDLQMRAWNNQYLAATTGEDRIKARRLEDSLSALAKKHMTEIIEQLESGPPSNRVIAASALGFTRDPKALSPLLAALDDPHEEVVGNALLGLMLLGQKEIPLDAICRLMQTSRDEGVRRNAAQCLAGLVDGGDRADCVAPAARAGLSDTEPAVRSQCCLILATLVDKTSVQPLCDRLYDDTPLVVASAARAVAYLGMQSPTDKGTCARALAKAYSDMRGPMRVQIRRALVELAGIDRGKEAEDWTTWAARLP